VELGPGRVIRRLGGNRRNNFTKDRAKDGTVPNVSRLKRSRSDQMAATAQTVVILFSGISWRTLLRTFCCPEKQRPLLSQRLRPIFSARFREQQIFNTQAEENRDKQEESGKPPRGRNTEVVHTGSEYQLNTNPTSEFSFKGLSPDLLF